MERQGINKECQDKSIQDDDTTNFLYKDINQNVGHTGIRK